MTAAEPGDVEFDPPIECEVLLNGRWALADLYAWVPDEDGWLADVSPRDGASNPTRIDVPRDQVRTRRLA